MITGLVVGKFSPLHKGHEALFDFARARCDRLIILSYSKPEFPGCEADRRASWLAALRPDDVRLVLDDAALAAFGRARSLPVPMLPGNDAPDEEHREFVAWVCRMMLDLSVDRVFTSESYGDGFAATLARVFGHPVEHVAFDLPRMKIGISGTALRSGTAAPDQFLSPMVRRTLVKRVALVGGESTGKTTLAADLAAALGTSWVAEFGRELWEERGGALVFEDMVAIAHAQIAREEEALDQAERWLVCDTTPLVTAFYSEVMFGRVDPVLATLASRPYDHIFLCAADFGFVQDGTRQDAAFRERQNAWYAEKLTERGVAFHILEGSIAKRRAAALAYLQS